MVIYSSEIICSLLADVLKFEAIMCEYKKTRNVSILKQSLDIVLKLNDRSS